MIGTKLAHYEITSHLGHGAMGEVYEAIDAKLGRSVAIKLLPEAFTHDADRAVRFQREARVLASLNHPNIAAIHGIEEAGGRKFLVMELVPGETLAKRIRRGPIPINEAMPIAKQIAEGLEAAHEKGFVHRDLKPANIKITPQGQVKVLDFGLAKAFAGGPSNPSASDSPTMSLTATEQGIILGTAAYMAPEQATGAMADWRADIWAFGAVFFEMVTGERAFAGATVSEILAHVLAAEPALDTAPAIARAIIGKCLRKDLRKRWQSIGDVRLAIDEGPIERIVPTFPRRRVLASLPWIVAALLFLALIVTMSVYAPHQAQAPRQPVRFTIPIPGGSGPDVVFALSPSGRYLAITAVENGKRQLWVRPIDALEARLLPGTDGATSPFWSPNESEIGFMADDKLKKISVAGGSAFTLTDSSSTLPGASWSGQGVILFSSNTDLLRVDESGGKSVPVVLHQSNEFLSDPQFLPDGDRFLFVKVYGEQPGIYVGSLSGLLPVRILEDVANATYMPSDRETGSGFLLFSRGGSLMAQRFNPETLTLSGSAKPLAESVIKIQTWLSALFSASMGTLAYQSESTNQLSWVDRSGAPKDLVGPAGDYGNFRISPDETKIAMDINRTENGAANRDVAVFDTKRGVLERLTFNAAADLVPVWSPDGLTTAFTSNRLGAFDPHVTSAPNQEKLLADMEPLGGWPTDWSHDGQFIIWQDGTSGAVDLWIVPVSGNPKPYAFLKTPFAEKEGVFSRDGRWIAYSSNESGRDEIYVRSFSGTGRGYPVSGTGGTGPAWAKDGRELFYVAGDSKLTVVPVTLGNSSVEFGKPQTLFTAPVGTFRRNYEVSKDGQRFLISRPAQAGGAAITVVLNWQALLER